MKNIEEMGDQTARDLFAMVFDNGVDGVGVAVPPDDLAPAAMADYRRWRRWRTTVVGAGASAAVVAVASVALVAGGGGRGAGGTTPGVWSSRDSSATPTAPSSPGRTGSPTGQGPSTSAVGGDAGHVVDCFTNFAVDGTGLAKARADCEQAEQLWRAVFPGAAVSGARNPGFVQITSGFLARVSTQKASAPARYGQAQPQVVQDWAQARQAVADAGDQTWSGFNIAAPQGTIIVSGTFRPGTYSKSLLRCWGETPCTEAPLSDTTMAEIGGAGGVHGYTVTVRSQAGDSYQFSFSSHYDPRYVDVPCSAPGGHCYADLTDGSIRPGDVPDRSAVIQNAVVTHAVLMDIVNRPAFAALAKGYIDGKLGQTGTGS